jgi:hypothetical protein
MHTFLHALHTNGKHAQGKHGAQHALQSTFVCAQVLIDVAFITSQKMV